MRPDLQPRTPDDPARRPRAGKPGRYLPLLIFGVIFVAIAAREIPAVGGWLQRWFQPEAWQAGQSCRDAALALATRPEHARVIEPGQAHPTQGGYFVEAIIVGEMAEAGGETRFAVACYTDKDGRLVRADRVQGVEP